MKINLTLVLSLVFTLLLAQMVSPQGVLLPEYYDGVVFIDGQHAPQGTEIVVKSHNTREVVGKGVVYEGGVYSLIEGVIFDNNFAEGVDEGASVGESLDWYVNGVMAYKPAPGSVKAEPGGINRNFDIYMNSISKPPTFSCWGGLIYFLGALLAFLFFEALFTLLNKVRRK